MEFHVFQKKADMIWRYEDSHKSESELKNFLLEQEADKVVTGDFLIIYGAEVRLIKKECLVIKKE